MSIDEFVDDELVLDLVEDLLVRRLDVLDRVHLTSLQTTTSELRFHLEHSPVRTPSDVLGIHAVHILQELVTGWVIVRLGLIHCPE
jgi:hypothetical protein